VIISSVLGNHWKLYLLHGPAGVGKTFVYQTVCYELRSHTNIVLCITSSGVASLLLPGGRTAHSAFKIPINDINEESFCKILKQSFLAKLIRMTSLIIWDEIGPQNTLTIEAVDWTCQDIIGVASPFGGITVVFGGDLQQMLPVVRNGSHNEIVADSLPSSSLWGYIEVLHLHTNMHLLAGDRITDPNQVSFAQWLLNVGEGHSLNATSDSGVIAFKPETMTTSRVSLIDYIYGQVGMNSPPPPAYFLNWIILAPRNDNVAETNEHVLAMMAGDCCTYFCVDEVIREAGTDPNYQIDDLPAEFLCTVDDGSLPPGELNVKLGCPLILLHNLAPLRGLCNGTQMVITGMSAHCLQIQIMGGCHGQQALIPCIMICPSDPSHFVFKWKHQQFPVKLAFALTVNKAQGQSVKYVGINLTKPVFAHGQLYVALSCVTSHRNLHILLPNDSSSSVNVVYKDVLSKLSL
jgi:hypothetical protein